MRKKKLVVIGGGSAGHKIAYLLQDSLDVTLVDPKNYLEVPMALPRLLVEPTGLLAQISYSDFLPRVAHLQGKAVSIAANSLVVETDANRITLPFDLAVVATGSRYIEPLIKAELPDQEDRQAQIYCAHHNLKSARSVVIVGGGPVGVEIAAELRESTPHLDVTLVHAAGKLLETGPTNFGDWALERLHNMGAKVWLNDAVILPAVGNQPLDGKVVTKTGRTVSADIIIWATGTRPNTEFLAQSWPHLVQENGLLKTDDYLRLEGFSNIFVAGDVTNLPEGRLAIIASFHASSIVRNIKSIASASHTSRVKLKPYAPRQPGKGIGKMMIVTLGQYGGLTSLPFGQFKNGFIARHIKSKSMFVNQYKKDIGLH